LAESKPGAAPALAAPKAPAGAYRRGKDTPPIRFAWLSCAGSDRSLAMSQPSVRDEIEVVETKINAGLKQDPSGQRIRDQRPAARGGPITGKRRPAPF
jgi:hypothetical protein